MLMRKLELRIFVGQHFNHSDFEFRTCGSGTFVAMADDEDEIIKLLDALALRSKNLEIGEDSDTSWVDRYWLSFG
jgi:hypothetical protein